MSFRPRKCTCTVELVQCFTKDSLNNFVFFLISFLFTAYHTQRVISNIARHPARASKQICFHSITFCFPFMCTNERRQRWIIATMFFCARHWFHFIEFHVFFLIYVATFCNRVTITSREQWLCIPNDQAGCPRCRVCRVLLVSRFFRLALLLNFFLGILFFLCDNCFFLGAYRFCQVSFFYTAACSSACYSLAACL